MKIVIFGNSGSGKSTLAKKFSSNYSASRLDLDTIAWKKTTPPEREDLTISTEKIHQFIKSHSSWVIEGCYSDLLSSGIEKCDKLIFLNPGFEICVQNCRNRPWEPHKYESPEQQDANLPGLIAWVQRYSFRDDEFSLAEHRHLFDNFKGQKAEYKLAPEDLFSPLNARDLSPE